MLGTSQGVITHKALDKRPNKTGGVVGGGQARSTNRSKLHVLRIADGPTATKGHIVHIPPSINNQKHVRQRKIHLKLLVDWLKPSLLLKRPSLMVGQQSNSSHQQKQYN
jgi:hypothetical protein